MDIDTRLDDILTRSPELGRRDRVEWLRQSALDQALERGAPERAFLGSRMSSALPAAFSAQVWNRHGASADPTNG